MSMKDPRIHKLTVNIGVGESGEKLQKAEKLLQDLLGQKPIRCYAKATHPELGVKKHAAIGIKVTLRRDKADEFLKKALEAAENEVKESQFDRQGNLSFGVHEYIELPDTKYDPDIGMFGMDVSVNLERPGYRIARRRKMQKKLSAKYRITKEEAIDFFQKNYNVKVIE